MPGDVINAIQEQNAQVSAGQLGGAPSVAGQQLNVTITAQSRLETTDQFARILLRVNSDGSAVRIGDVARVEMGSESYDVRSRYNGKPATGIAVRLASGANALATADTVRAFLQNMEPFYPAGLKMVEPYDTTPFVRLSIEEVIKTLGEAIVLVFLVM